MNLYSKLLGLQNCFELLQNLNNTESSYTESTVNSPTEWVCCLIFTDEFKPHLEDESSDNEESSGEEEEVSDVSEESVPESPVKVRVKLSHAVNIKKLVWES